MTNNQKLPAAERVEILTGWIESLLRGSETHLTRSSRNQAIDAAEDALRQAMADLVKEAAH